MKEVGQSDMLKAVDTTEILETELIQVTKNIEPQRTPVTHTSST